MVSETLNLDAEYYYCSLSKEIYIYTPVTLCPF